MGYIDDKLTENEHVVYRTKLHWATLLGPGMLIVLGGLSVPSKGMSAVVLLAIGVMWGIFSSISLQTSEIGITNERLLLKLGFPLRRTYDIPLAKVGMVDIHQPSLGKFLNFGKIIIGFTDGKRGSFRMVREPIEFRIRLERQINTMRQE